MVKWSAGALTIIVNHLEEHGFSSRLHVNMVKIAWLYASKVRIVKNGPGMTVEVLSWLMEVLKAPMLYGYIDFRKVKSLGSKEIVNH